MDKRTIDFIITGIIFAFTLIMHYTAIKGIIKKKFNTVLLVILFGALGSERKRELSLSELKRKDPEYSDMIKNLENDQAIGAAILQIFLAFLIDIMIFGWYFTDELHWISDSTYRVAVPIAIILMVVVAVTFAVRTGIKRKNLKEQ
jgi:hypothetical protein